MLQNPCKTLGFKKNMVYKIPPWGGGGGKPYPASGLRIFSFNYSGYVFICLFINIESKHLCDILSSRVWIF